MGKFSQASCQIPKEKDKATIETGMSKIQHDTLTLMNITKLKIGRSNYYSPGGQAAVVKTQQFDYKNEQGMNVKIQASKIVKAPIAGQLEKGVHQIGNSTQKNNNEIEVDAEAKTNGGLNFSQSCKFVVPKELGWPARNG